MLAGFSGKPLTGKAYNVSSGQMTSLVKIVNTIKRFEKSVKVEFKPRVQDKISYCCDASRFKREYSWEPKTSLLQGIEKSLKYFGKRK